MPSPHLLSTQCNLTDTVHAVKLWAIKCRRDITQMHNSACVSLRSLGLSFFACVLAMQHSTADGSTLLRGENRTCRDFADLDYALDHPSSLYFRGWRTEDFDAAQAWVESCLASPPTKGDRERQSLLALRRASLETRGEVQRNDQITQQFRDAQIQDQRDKAAELKAEQSARRAEEAKEDARRHVEENERNAKRQAHDACLRSDSYQRYLAGTRIFEALDRESAAQQALDRERRVEQASGTANLYTKHSAGESLIAAQDDLNKWWTLYQQHGGDAKNPQALARSIGNPCD
jgi:hypothetical protein